MNNLGGFKICGKRGHTNYASRSKAIKKDGKIMCSDSSMKPCFPLEDDQYLENVICVNPKVEKCPIT